MQEVWWEMGMGSWTRLTDVGGAHAGGGLGEEGDAGRPGPAGVGGAVVAAQVAQPGRAEQRVAGGVGHDVAVGVALGPDGLVDEEEPASEISDDEGFPSHTVTYLD